MVHSCFDVENINWYRSGAPGWLSRLSFRLGFNSGHHLTVSGTEPRIEAWHFLSPSLSLPVPTHVFSLTLSKTK